MSGPCGLLGLLLLLQLLSPSSALLWSRRSSSPQQRFVIVSFVTLGPPFDNGTNYAASRQYFMDLLAPHADGVFVFSPFHLDNDPWWRANYHWHPNTTEWVLPNNPGAQEIGYWKYKPLILLRMCQMQPPGTVIMYLDCHGLRKYPFSALGSESWRGLALQMLEENAPADIWLAYENAGHVLVKQYSKGYTVHNISNPAYEKLIFERSLLLGNRIIVRNTERLRTMLEKELLPLFAMDDLLAPFPQEPGRHPDNKDNTGDQSIWNAFLFNELYSGRLPKYWPKYGTQDRKFTKRGLMRWDED